MRDAGGRAQAAGVACPQPPQHVKPHTQQQHGRTQRPRSRAKAAAAAAMAPGGLNASSHAAALAQLQLSRPAPLPHASEDYAADAFSQAPAWSGRPRTCPEWPSHCDEQYEGEEGEDEEAEEYGAERYSDRPPSWQLRGAGARSGEEQHVLLHQGQNEGSPPPLFQQQQQQGQELQDEQQRGCGSASHPADSSQLPTQRMEPHAWGRGLLAPQAWAQDPPAGALPGASAHAHAGWQPPAPAAAPAVPPRTLAARSSSPILGADSGRGRDAAAPALPGSGSGGGPTASEGVPACMVVPASLVVPGSMQETDSTQPPPDYPAIVPASVEPGSGSSAAMLRHMQAAAAAGGLCAQPGSIDGLDARAAWQEQQQVGGVPTAWPRAASSLGAAAMAAHAVLDVVPRTPLALPCTLEAAAAPRAEPPSASPLALFPLLERTPPGAVLPSAGSGDGWRGSIVIAATPADDQALAEGRCLDMPSRLLSGQLPPSPLQQQDQHCQQQYEQQQHQQWQEGGGVDATQQAARDCASPQRRKRCLPTSRFTIDVDATCTAASGQLAHQAQLIATSRDQLLAAAASELPAAPADATPVLCLPPGQSVAEVRLPGVPVALLSAGCFLAAVMPAPAQRTPLRTGGGSEQPQRQQQQQQQFAAARCPAWQLALFAVEQPLAINVLGSPLEVRASAATSTRQPAAPEHLTPSHALALWAPASGKEHGAASGQHERAQLLLAMAAPLHLVVDGVAMPAAAKAPTHGVHVYQLLPSCHPDAHAEDNGGWHYSRGKSAAMPPAEAGDASPRAIKPTLLLALPAKRGVHCLAVSGAWLAAAGEEGTAVAWRWQQTQQQLQSGSPCAAAQAAAYSTLALPPATYKGIPLTEVSELAFSSDGSSSGGNGSTAATEQLLLVGVSQQGLLAVWDVHRQQLLMALYPCLGQSLAGLLPIAPHWPPAAASAAAAPSGHTGGGVLQPRLLLARAGGLLVTLALLRDGVQVGEALARGTAPCAAAAAGATVVTGMPCGRLRAWDVMTGGRVFAAQARLGCGVTCVQLLGDVGGTAPLVAAVGTSAGDLLMLRCHPG